LETDVAHRVLDLTSEIGEVAKEVLTSTRYGKTRFKKSESWEVENRMTLSPEPSPPLPPDEQFSRIRRSRALPHHRGAGNSDS
jgi:hypothetical protein